MVAKGKKSPASNRSVVKAHRRTVRQAARVAIGLHKPALKELERR